ncbi:hypothetical protein DH2020_026296 [Rehmannia glutinosa]|uniref:CAAX prenyl protease 2 n=1 Tax=Rehmannia glutinosa TaxID=99300 RepID=A0ABR0W074_REHGL
MEQLEGGGGVTKPAAVAACTAMAVFYVAILYSPTLILRLPPPNSFKSFMIRRFVCAAISSLVSLVVCFLILPIRGWDASNLFGVYGIRLDHIVSTLYETVLILRQANWQALVFPLSLSSFMYTGSFAVKLLSMLQASNEHLNSDENLSAVCIKNIFLRIIDWVVSKTSCVSSWRNYFVVSVLLFPIRDTIGFSYLLFVQPLSSVGYVSGATYGRSGIQSLYDSFATMWRIQYLYRHISLSNIFQFSLLKACQVVGLQLGYTVIFGAYASFLFVRSGHLTAPLVAHIFCNFMGLPVIFSRRDSKCSICDGDAEFFLDAFPIVKSAFVQQ